jgi:hypothetical protein
MLKPLLASLFLSMMFSSLAQKRNAANSLAVAAGQSAGNNRISNNEVGVFKTSITRKVMDIKVPEGGANGGAVVYHPKEKLYYAAQTGNKDFPLVIFDESGDVVSSPDQNTLMDIRGLWYNPKTKEIGGNGYKDYGWFTYDLDKKGMVEGINNFKKGRWQPDDHSPGVLNTEDNEVLFLVGMNIECYNTDGTAKNKTLRMYVGQKSADDGNRMTISDFEANYNFRSIIYTGYEGAEIGFLNVTKKQVELYNIKTGYMTRIVKANLSYAPETYFNFSFSNDTYWFFNKTTRYWNGYREE